MTTQIIQSGETLTVDFTSFGISDYEVFLKCKRLPESRIIVNESDLTYKVETHIRYANLLGIEADLKTLDSLPLSEFLFEHQKEILKLALNAKRFAVWANVGLGKTNIELEFARQVSHITNGGRVLIMTLGEIVGQFIEESEKFYGDSLPLLKLESREEMRLWCKNGYSGKETSKFWHPVKDGNLDALVLYERHYSCYEYKDGRKRRGNKIVGPGERIVLLNEEKDALFVWRKFIDDSGQKGVNCAVFRNESNQLSSEMIKDATELAWNKWNGERLYTYVDAEKVESENPGYCFIKAGWKKCGVTKSGKLIFEKYPPRIAVTNYEKMNPDEKGQIVSEFKFLAGIILDESSRLKAGGGKQKWALIKSSKGIPYKLSCTAMPAPNDYIEFASQASFLERMRDENEIIWTFFARDKQTNEWTVKRHAREAFFEWMAAWSIYLKLPQSFGWSSDYKLPPEPEIIRHEIPITAEQFEQSTLFNIDTRHQPNLFAGTQSQGIVGRSKMSQIAKGFVYIDGKKKLQRIESHKPQKVADLIIQDVSAGLQVLVWTIFDEESEIIADALRDYSNYKIDFEILSGSMPKAKRPAVLENFRKGITPVLISKASLLGYGMNFQMCGSMIFSGWNDSFESFYQAVGRAVRYGQQKSVKIHLPFVRELEYEQLENVFRKQAQFETAILEQEKAYIKAMQNLKLLN